MNFKSLPQLLDYFKDEETCIKYYEKLRWNGNPVCPFCESEKPYLTNRGYKCSNSKCHKKFTVKVGGIFENSKISLRIFYAAIYLIVNHKKGISSLQLASDLAITQKTAWFVLHRVREMLKQQSPEMLNENKTVEADETYIGGKEQNKHKKKRSKDADGNYVNIKKVVVGIIERDGKVVLRHIDSASKENMVAFIHQFVPKGSTIYTDEATVYKGLKKRYTHDTVNHKIKVYVAGNTHTNTIENFWSVLKRGLNGIYHSVSDKHLDRYLNEFASRFNSRTLGNEDRFDLFLSQSESRLTYNNLIEKKIN